MVRTLPAALLSLALAAAGHAQGGRGCCGYGPGPVTGAPLVEIEGKIAEVRIAPGVGMPTIVVKSGGADSAVLLGPLRYLMAQDFNPKVGDEVALKAYKTANGLIGASVTLTRVKKTIRLRDEQGFPVWRGGRW